MEKRVDVNALRECVRHEGLPQGASQLRWGLGSRPGTRVGVKGPWAEFATAKGGNKWIPRQLETWVLGEASHANCALCALRCTWR